MRAEHLAVLFDVDGTLVESEREGHRVAFNQAFAEADMPDRWDERRYGELLAVSGGRQRLRHYLREQGRPEAEAEALAARLHARKTEVFREMVHADDIPARPGALRLLDELEAAGATIGIATTGSRAWVAPLLQRLIGRDRLAVELTADEVPDRKPSPAIYERAVAALDAAPGDVVVIEDSGNGVAAASAAGLACLAVANGYTRAELLSGNGGPASGAGLVVDGFGDPGRAEVLRGPGRLLEDGAVTVATIAALADRHRVRPGPTQG